MSSVASPPDETDVVIIGSGAGGAPIAARLAQAGLSVTVLEAGRAFDPTDHTPDEPSADLYWMEERLSGGRDPTAFGANNSGQGVGGSLLHWGAFCPRPDPRDLTLASETGRGRDWPFGWAALKPYVETVEAVIGVSGPADYPWGGRRFGYPNVRRNAPADAMARGAEAVGLTVADAPAAVLSRDREGGATPHRGACVNCGACHQGCRTGAKGGADNSFLPIAQANGANIIADARAVAVERHVGGRIKAVVYRREGREHRLDCRALFLRAGGVETPRLLLNWGLANAGGEVGRNFMTHVATQVWGRFDADMSMNRGYPSSLISEQMVRPSDADFAGGYLIQSLGVMPVTLAGSFARGAGLWGAPLVETLRDYRRLAGIGINGECLPADDNRLTLSDEVDAVGLRKARIDFGYGENERRLDAHARRVMTDLWSAAGAEDIFAVARSAHTIGGCRMGNKADGAVVDANGCSVEIDNLYVCDNSVFPSALSANPALTLMAVALRTADRFLDRQRKGEF
ncbi:GMC family oxidoreductase [Brevundimonas sp.]|uniref:GMC family oxidoreductase n=1 Tax=Brevundimonas sp. TaxID=1871086 RepID=UPI002896D201|nr:GMC family oxidoreductase [Brevundimonas sp.]